MIQEQTAKDTCHSNLICSSTLLRYPLSEQNNQEILEKELKSESENISILNNVNKKYENIPWSINYINESLCVRVINLTKIQIKKICSYITRTVMRQARLLISLMKIVMTKIAYS